VLYVKQKQKLRKQLKVVKNNLSGFIKQLIKRHRIIDAFFC
jgi:hypothetical protein